MSEKPTFEEMMQKMIQRIQELERSEIRLKNVEKDLKESKNRYHALIEDMPALICSYLPDGEITFVNRSYCEYFDRTFDDLAGSNFLSLIPESEQKGVMDNILTLTVESPTMSHEHQVISPNGNIRWHRWTNRALFDDQGKVSGYQSVGEDITERKQAEEELKSLKEKYEDLYNNAPTMYLSVDTRRIITECNNTILNKLGYARDEFIGKSLHEFITEESAASMKKDFPELLRMGKIHGVDRQLVAKNGTIIDSILSVTMEYDEHGNPIKTRATFEDISERKRAEDQIHNLSQMLMQAQEHERKVISCELHDCIAQNLSSLKIDSDTIFDNQRGIPDDLKGKMAKHSKLIEQTIQTVRDLSYGLHPPGLNEIGIVQTISQYVEDFTEKTGVEVDFTPAGMDGLKPDHNMEINLYRLVQEGLNNVGKHADAGHVAVKLIAAHPNIILRIEDDGKGFDIQAREEALFSEKRMGLRSMKERVNLLQGRMTIQSRPKLGTKMLIKFPFSREKK